MSLRSIKKNWEGLADKDPFWAICTHPEKKGGTWDEKDFFQTGENEITRLLDYLKSKQITLPDNEIVLEFGCGVGRLLRALYPHFQSLVGVDVSRTMIEKAETLNRKYLDKITFEILENSPGSLFETGSVSLVISLIVFQHITKSHSCRYIIELLQLLKPGGLFIFQLITRDVRSWKWMRRIRSRIRIRERLAMAGIGDHFQMEMHVLNELKVCRLIRENGGEILDVRITNHTDPAYEGNLRFIDEKDSIDYVSKLFIVRRKSGEYSNSED